MSLNGSSPTLVFQRTNFRNPVHLPNPRDPGKLKSSRERRNVGSTNMTKSSSLVMLPTPMSALSETSWVDHIRVSNKKTLTVMGQDKGSSTGVTKPSIKKTNDDDSVKPTHERPDDGDGFVSLDRNRTMKALTSIIQNAAPMTTMMDPLKSKSNSLNTKPSRDQSTHNPHFRIHTAPEKIGLLHPSLCARTSAQYADFEHLLPHEKVHQASMNVSFSMDQLKTTQGELYVPILDRYAQRRAEVTDWTRVGVGGQDGVSPQSGLYGDPANRFLTTEHESFALRDGGVGSRDKVSREHLRLAKQEANLNATARLAQGCRDATELAKCREFGRMNAKSSQKLRYIKAVCAEEVKSLESVHMSKRSAGLASSRMWRGSEHNQFNYLNRTVSLPDLNSGVSQS